MIALAFWFGTSVVAGLLIGGAIRACAADLPSVCSQNCNQGRNCTCIPMEETQP